MAARKNYPERKVPYKPRPTPYKSKGKPRGPEPHRWLSGPDPLRHTQYIAWLRAKAQANFRGEQWLLSFEDFEQIWNQDGSWHQRGRAAEDLLMTRLDASQAWSKENCYLEERRRHLQRHAKKQRGKTKKTIEQGRRRHGKHAD